MNPFENEMRELLQARADDVTPSYGIPPQIKRRVVMNRVGVAFGGAAVVVASGLYILHRETLRRTASSKAR